MTFPSQKIGQIFVRLSQCHSSGFHHVFQGKEIKAGGGMVREGLPCVQGPSWIQDNEWPSENWDENGTVKTWHSEMWQFFTAMVLWKLKQRSTIQRTIPMQRKRKRCRTRKCHGHSTTVRQDTKVSKCFPSLESWWLRWEKIKKPFHSCQWAVPTVMLNGKFSFCLKNIWIKLRTKQHCNTAQTYFNCRWDSLSLHNGNLTEEEHALLCRINYYFLQLSAVLSYMISGNNYKIGERKRAEKRKKQTHN